MARVGPLPPYGGGGANGRRRRGARACAASRAPRRNLKNPIALLVLVVDRVGNGGKRRGMPNNINEDLSVAEHKWGRGRAPFPCAIQGGMLEAGSADTCRFGVA